MMPRTLKRLHCAAVKFYIPHKSVTVLERLHNQSLQPLITVPSVHFHINVCKCVRKSVGMTALASLWGPVAENSVEEASKSLFMRKRQQHMHKQCLHPCVIPCIHIGIHLIIAYISLIMQLHHCEIMRMCRSHVKQTPSSPSSCTPPQ